MDPCPGSIVDTRGGSGWESNPPRPATRPATGFEDQETHRDLTTPGARIIEPGIDCKRHSPWMPHAGVEKAPKQKTLRGESLLSARADRAAPQLCRARKRIIDLFPPHSPAELESQHCPPGVRCHHQEKHPQRQAFPPARLLVAYTQIFHSPLKFIFNLFHN